MEETENDMLQSPTGSRLITDEIPLLYSQYTSCLLVPMCKEACSITSNCGSCLLARNVYKIMRNVDIKYTDCVLRMPVLFEKYIQSTPIFVTMSDVLFVYFTRIQYIYWIIADPKNNDMAKLMKPLIEKKSADMIVQVRNPAKPIRFVLNALEDFILYCEALFIGYTEEIYINLQRKYISTNLIQYPNIVTCTKFEEEVLNNMVRELSELDSDGSFVERGYKRFHIS